MLFIKSVNICIYIKLFLIIEAYGKNITSDTHIKISTTSTTNKISSEGGVVVISEENHIQKVETTISKPNSTINNATVEETTKLNRDEFKMRNTTVSMPKTSLNISAITSKTTTTEKIIPVSEEEVPISINMTNNQSSTTEKIEITGDSKIKPRKGAPEYIPENITSTTDKSRKKKPTVTVGSDDDSKSFIDHRNSKKDNSSTLKTEGILGVNYKPDYILPIVMTILAVPLIAIVFAVLYKRGSEWWQHRHYRRMDFLIDGIYNN